MVRAKRSSVSFGQAHSSSICEGDSTKSRATLVPGERRELRLAEEVVDHVAELVEERDRVLVAHQRRRGAARLREVALDRRDRHRGASRRGIFAVSRMLNTAACLYLPSRG